MPNSSENRDGSALEGMRRCDKKQKFIFLHPPDYQHGTLGMFILFLRRSRRIPEDLISYSRDRLSCLIKNEERGEEGKGEGNPRHGQTTRFPLN